MKPGFLPFATLLLLLLASASACKETKRSSDNLGIRYGAKRSDLMAHMTDLRNATLSGDIKTASALTMLLLPDDDDLHLAIRSDAKKEFKKIAELHRKFIPKDDFTAATMFGGRPEMSEIQLHAATARQLTSYRRGSIARREFPEEVRKAAKKVLRPNIKFYEVELLEPGHSVGMKYHLFFHNGKNWKMLGPIWRVL